MKAEQWKRVCLWLMLFVSLAFNFILKSDNDYMDIQMKLMKNGFIENVVGYNYCPEPNLLDIDAPTET